MKCMIFGSLFYAVFGGSYGDRVWDVELLVMLSGKRTTRALGVFNTQQQIFHNSFQMGSYLIATASLSRHCLVGWRFHADVTALVKSTK